MNDTVQPADEIVGLTQRQAKRLSLQQLVNRLPLKHHYKRHMRLQKKHSVAAIAARNGDPAPPALGSKFVMNCAKREVRRNDKWTRIITMAKKREREIIEGV